MKVPKRIRQCTKVFIWMVAVALGFILINAGIKATRVDPPKPLTVKEIVEGKSKTVLVDWVYSRSNRISKKECNEIVVEAMKYQKPLLLLSIMDVESNFTPTATSSKNAMGLMQVMPGVWDKDLISKGFIKERRDLYDVGPNILSGNYVLNICLGQASGDLSKALERYLGGKDGAYVKQIFSNLGTLYLITDSRLH